MQQAARMVSGGGSIVYIGSGSTLRPVTGFGLYASSKLPASYLVGVLAQEIGERGVTVNAVIASATEGAGYFTVGSDDSPFRCACRTPARSPRGWARSTTSRTQSSSLPASSRVGSAGSSC